MAKVTYEQARADHEYLWGTYAPAHDMTGAYVDQEDLAKLLRSPTKETAAKCYIAQIEYWFQRGPDTDNDDWKTDPKVHEIAERHYCDTRLLEEPQR